MPTSNDYMNQIPNGILLWSMILGGICVLIGTILWWVFGGAN